MTAAVSPRHLVLVGMMATGKSTVGRGLSDALAWPLVDTDAAVEASVGRSVRDIWAADGEDEFRRLESDALVDALAGDTSAVIAAAGGVVLAERNRARLNEPDVVVVWLRAEPATLLERVLAAQDAHRPLLDGDPAGMLERMSVDRSALYASVADVIVDVDDETVEDVTATILAHVAEAFR